jgi:glycosyltransferase involved in cell wall biosynthesis
MSDPMVSVVVPVWNGSRFLAECIRSVLAQEHVRLQVLVVDDGSTDDSVAIASGFGAPVTVLRRRHSGPAAARNAGIEACSGDYVAFVDCDDLWLPGKLVRQLAYFDEHPQAQMCLTWVQNFWEAEVAADAAAYADHPMSKPYGGYSIQAVLARRATVERLPRFPEHLRHGENAVWFENARAAGVVLHEIPEVFVRRRLHGGNMTRLEPDGFSEGVLQLLHHRLRSRRKASS